MRKTTSTWSSWNKRYGMRSCGDKAMEAGGNQILMFFQKQLFEFGSLPTEGEEIVLNSR